MDVSKTNLDFKRESSLVGTHEIFQIISSIPTTLGLLAEMILKQLCSIASQMSAQRVDFVIDNYYEKSVKDAESLKGKNIRKKMRLFAFT